MKLVFRLELRHSLGVRSCKDFKQLGFDTHQLFFDGLITEIDNAKVQEDIFEFMQEAIAEHTAPMAFTRAIKNIASLSNASSYEVVKL